MTIRTSFRTRILLIVLAVGIVPLLVLGLWLAGQTARSGEELLRGRLADALDRTAHTIAQRWVPLRSELLDVVETEDVRTWLDPVDDLRGAVPRAVLAGATESLDPAIVGLTVHVGDETVWSLDRESVDASRLFGAPLTVALPIFAVDGRRLGTLVSRIRFLALRGPAEVSTAGEVLSALDPATGAVLSPVPFDPTLVGRTEFTWNDAEWVGMTKTVAEPPLILTAAALARPFNAPFESTATDGLVALLAVSALGLLAALSLTGRLTSSLEQLARAARDVAGGDLVSTLPVRGQDEVGAVTEAFNTMIRSLRSTLRDLADRESLAAVNEFAASLAHEVRNPLTSVQLDLQRVEEDLPPGSDLRALQGEAIEELRRLDRTVGRALDVARSGSVDPRPIELLGVLRTAIRRARPAVERRGGRIELDAPAGDLPVVADPDALEQLFLNLLLNAGDAVEQDQGIRVSVRGDDDAIRVLVEDEGLGIAVADLERVFEPFFTTRAGGTGLGLAVARRIVTAHHGSIRIESQEGVGTRVHVDLPTHRSIPAG